MKINVPFLERLVATHSPSGAEAEIQKHWYSYVKEFAHEMKVDSAGNVIGILNPEAEFKVLLAGHCDEIAFMVSSIDSDGFISFQKVGGISQKLAVGMQVNILGEGGPVKGVIGANAEHHGGIKDGFEIEDLFIDCGAKSKGDLEGKVKIGDYIIYDTQSTTLMHQRLSGRGLDNRTGAFIVAEVLRQLSQRNIKVGVYAASTVNEETNLGGAYFASAGLKPTIAIACDVTFATDYPSVNKKKHGDVKLDGGPVLAKGAPIHPVINCWLEDAAAKHNIAIQYELTPRNTGTDADRMRYTNAGVPVALVSLPLRYMHSPVETASLLDIEQEVTLLVEMIASLTGEENLIPFSV